ncbi:MAG: aldo/keto reductase [Flavobacteriaceae bacterium]|nr:aldo/keto reductase [Flavobacteriaceae bacterium]
MDTSKIISGTMSWGVWGANFKTIEMTDLIEKSVEIGITTFDHADIYGGYTTEVSFGESFKLSSISRNKVQFITKCGIQYICDKRPNIVKHYDYSTKYIVKSVEESLKNLKTEFIDILLLHRPSPLMNPDEIAEAFFKLKKEEKVKSFGVSNFTQSQIDLLSSEDLIKWNQFECSLSRPDTFFNGLLDSMINNKIKSMAWSPLGDYFKQTSKQNDRIKTIVTELCKKYQVKENQILLAWILKHPGNIIPVVGTTSPKRLKESYDAVNLNLNIQDWFLLLEASLGYKVP